MHKKISPKIIPLFLAVFIVVFAMTFVLFQRTALANFVVNAWQGYRLNSGLVGYWSFDGKDMVPNVRDASGQGNNGGLQNQNPTTTTIGKIGQGLSFDGVDDYVSVANNSALQFSGAVPITLSAWVNPAQNTSYGTFLIKGRVSDATAANYALRQDVTGKKLEFYFNDTSSINWHIWSSTSDVFTSTNTWYHVSVRYTFGTGSSIVVYVNGQPVAGSWTLGTGNVTADVDTQAFVFGQITAGERFSGKLDEVRVYNRVLSPDEARRLYLMGASLKTNVTHRDELTSGLVGEWTFDGKDMTPNVRDVSGQGNHGGLQNQNPTTTTIGKIGQGLNFDGVNDFVNRGAGTGMNFTKSTPFSGSAWIKTNASGESSIVSNWNLNVFPGWQWSINQFTAGKVAFLLTDSTGVNYFGVDGSTNVNDGKWHHVIFTYDGSAVYAGIRMYVDGIAETLTSHTLGTANPGTLVNDSLQIGARNYSANHTYWNGSIDEVRIYDRVLSPDEAKRLYLMGASLKTNVTHRDELTGGLVGEWTFDGKDMTPNVRDVSGQGNHGGLQNQNPTTTTIGKIGQGLSFNGTNYVSVGTPVVSSYPATLTAWVKINSGSGYALSITNSASYNGWAISANPTTVGLLTVSGGGTDSTISLTVDATRWTFVVAVLTSATSRTLYANVISSVTDTANRTPTGLNSFNVGRLGGFWAANGFPNFYPGSIDDVRIYNRALSPEEVQRLYLMGK